MTSGTRTRFSRADSVSAFFFSGGNMTTLIDRIETRSTNGRADTAGTTPAERLRTTMAACRLQFTWFGHQEVPDRRAKGDPGRRAVRRPGPVPFGGQKTAGYEAQRLSGRYRDPHQDHGILAWDWTLCPSQKLEGPADQARSRSRGSISRWPTSARPSWKTPSGNLDRCFGELETGRCSATRFFVQSRGLSGDSGRTLRRFLGLSQQ